MALQVMEQILPCGKAASIRTLSKGIRIGDPLVAGSLATNQSGASIEDIVDGANYVVYGSSSIVVDGATIEAGATYVVSGTGGTIGYASSTYNPGGTFQGAIGSTTFTRSASTVILMRVGTATYDGTRYPVGRQFSGKSSPTTFTVAGGGILVRTSETTSVSENYLEDAYYIVSSSSENDMVTYMGVSYAPGEIFVGVGGENAPTFKATGSAVLYKIEDRTKILSLTTYKLGAVTLPGVEGLDFGESLGLENLGQGAAIPDPNATLDKIYIWNYGSSEARIYYRSYRPTIDISLGAQRQDQTILIPQTAVGNPEPFELTPTEFYRQGSGNSRYGTPDATEEDSIAALSAYILQTTSKDVWIKPLANLSLGVQNNE